MQTYTVRVELDATPDQEMADTLVDALAGFHPAVAPLGRRTEVIVSLPAGDLRLAVRTALAVILDAAPLGAATVSVTAMLAEEWDSRIGLDAAADLLSVTEAAELLGSSRQAILQRIDSGSLPARRVGKSWAIPRDAVEYVIARLLDADRHEVARVRATRGEDVEHDGMTYRPTGGSHTVQGGLAIATYLPA